MSQTSNRTEPICQNCTHWTSYNGQDGDCEHPQIREKVVCIAVPCLNNPDLRWTASVGYRTDPAFGCNLFQVHETKHLPENIAEMSLGSTVTIRVQPGEEAFREDIINELKMLHVKHVIKEIVLEETESERSRKAGGWAKSLNIPVRTSRLLESEDIILM